LRLAKHLSVTEQAKEVLGGGGYILVLIKLFKECTAMAEKIVFNNFRYLTGVENILLYRVLKRAEKHCCRQSIITELQKCKRNKQYMIF
jgi:hypothetical protein